jgi:hypothetical protein
VAPVHPGSTKPVFKVSVEWRNTHGATEAKVAARNLFGPPHFFVQQKIRGDHAQQLVIPLREGNGTEQCVLNEEVKWLNRPDQVIPAIRKRRPATVSRARSLPQ